jgi:hypothetical protein
VRRRKLSPLSEWVVLVAEKKKKVVCAALSISEWELFPAEFYTGIYTFDG